LLLYVAGEIESTLMKKEISQGNKFYKMHSNDKPKCYMMKDEEVYNNFSYSALRIKRKISLLDVPMFLT